MNLVPSHLRRLRRSDRGVVLVEFALSLPLLLVLFAMIIEGGRMMWSYQTAIAGVRDATRYAGRVVATDECPGRGASYSLPDPVGDRVPAIRAKLLDSISEPDPNAPSGKRERPGVELYPDNDAAVTISLDCSKGDVGQYRVAPVPIVIVSAQVRINFPFEGIFDLAGGMDPFVVTTITDRSRVFGS